MVVDTDGLSMKFDFQFSMVLMVLIVVMVLIVNLICPFAGSRYTENIREAQFKFVVKTKMFITIM